MRGLTSVTGLGAVQSTRDSIHDSTVRSAAHAVTCHTPRTRCTDPRAFVECQQCRGGDGGPVECAADGDRRQFDRPDILAAPRRVQSQSRRIAPHPGKSHGSVNGAL